MNSYSCWMSFSLHPLVQSMRHIYLTTVSSVATTQKLLFGSFWRVLEDRVCVLRSPNPSLLVGRVIHVEHYRNY